MDKIVQIHSEVDLGTRWKWVVNFTPRPFYPPPPPPPPPRGGGGDRHRYPLDWRLGGPGAGLDAVQKRKKILPLLGLWSPAVQPIARRYTDWAIPTPKLKNCPF
jgi:hypothetical protein